MSDKVHQIGWGLADDEPCPKCNSTQVIGCVNEADVEESKAAWTKQLIEMGLLKPKSFECKECKHKWRKDGS